MHVEKIEKPWSFPMQFPPLFAAGPCVEGHLLTTWFFLHLLEVRGEDIASGNIKLRGEEMLLVGVFFVSRYCPILAQFMTKTANYDIYAFYFSHCDTDLVFIGRNLSYMQKRGLVFLLRTKATWTIHMSWPAGATGFSMLTFVAWTLLPLCL